MRENCRKTMATLIGACYLLLHYTVNAQSNLSTLSSGFITPADKYRPGVYWYFMDGNMSAAAMTKDLESMKQQGIGNVVFLEVNVGVPRGPVDFLSEQWQNLFVHAVREAERLGIDITLGIGPGWTGSGGPWVKPAQSMLHLVASETHVEGPGEQHVSLKVPAPRTPYFTEDVFTPALKEEWNAYYSDVAVLGYPTPKNNTRISDIDEKALYYRAPYSSVEGVKPFLSSLAFYDSVPGDESIDKSQVVDLTALLKSDGTLDWKVPAGNWTIMRFVTRNNGAVTRPAPLPGLGFESDKFDTVALSNHLEDYVGRLLKKTGVPKKGQKGGLKRLHMDSWEMGSQNFTQNFRQEFIKRRKYDPLPFYPVYAGYVVTNKEMSERFLWDLRLTSQELVLEYHAGFAKKYAHERNMLLSIEPYDMNPAGDLELGNIADVPMCEFWSKNFGYNLSYSTIEATSIAHVNGISTVPAEAFTAENDAWKQYPSAMKNQGDWAFATGINSFVYHTFQHQYLDSNLKPGMTMGPFGVHWDRGQTWWPMAHCYHQYITRCQYMLQQGNSVADILYLSPEGSPNVFRAPASALEGDSFLPDRKGFNFDACAPSQLYKATVKEGKITFPGGASYSILVLPDMQTATPRLLEKITALVKAGATVIGTTKPVKAPGLTAYPSCDVEVSKLSAALWGDTNSKALHQIHKIGNGRLIYGNDFTPEKESIYPSYNAVASLLHQMNLKEDFTSNGSLRYIHRRTKEADIYFVSNRTNEAVNTTASFRVASSAPQLWNPQNAEMYSIKNVSSRNGIIDIQLQFHAYESFFIVFPHEKSVINNSKAGVAFQPLKPVATLQGAWQVFFDTVWGGPAQVQFDSLQNWATNNDKGIRFYSGLAIYKKQFDLPVKTINGTNNYFIDLGEVKNLASVKLNGHDIGVLWTTPWQLNITRYLKPVGNELEITVANLWPNRLIGDEALPYDGIKDNAWPDWLTEHKKRTSGRYTFTTATFYNKDNPLLPSGLLGPVTILVQQNK